VALGLFVVAFTVTLGCEPAVTGYHVIPLPRQVTPRSGSFWVDQSTIIALSNPSDEELLYLGQYGARMIADAVGIQIPVSSEPVTGDGPNQIVLALSSDSAVSSPEQYTLIVDERSVTISAPYHRGIFYGLQTLRQFLSAESPGVIPAVEIQDRPRFPYRGMHLDVGRHFFPVSFVKKYIDLIAMYKMNTFHWHLTEDQGWRIEIKKYPRLTQIGAYRKETVFERNFDPYIGDGIPHGGFYTQDEIREVVKYAHQRYVTVIPEIEMPGHSTAALAAYPQLACTEGPIEVSTNWGVHDDIYCPREGTFTFIQDVLTEVIDLFPSQYIHIGGDEVPKDRWHDSEVAQEIIRREGLADEQELQSYFIRRIEAFLLQHGRRLIGWDEILEGGLAPEATVMSWRGLEGGIEAAHQGHDVIMTPNSHVYFDHYQGEQESEPLAIGGYSPLDKVYQFEPVPEGLTDEEARHVLGAQGNVWTEYMRTTDYVEYMVFPRMLALSEVVWSPKEARNWDSFLQRLGPHMETLDRIGVNYRVPEELRDD
jgi:hexosaminidase